jgi:hypothetical protein
VFFSVRRFAAGEGRMDARIMRKKSSVWVPGSHVSSQLQQALAPNKVRAGETGAEYLVFMNQVSRFHHTDRLRS